MIASRRVKKFFFLYFLLFLSYDIDLDVVYLIDYSYLIIYYDWS